MFFPLIKADKFIGKPGGRSVEHLLSMREVKKTFCDDDDLTELPCCRFKSMSEYFHKNLPIYYSLCYTY